MELPQNIFCGIRDIERYFCVSNGLALYFGIGWKGFECDDNWEIPNLFYPKFNAVDFAADHIGDFHNDFWELCGEI